MCPVCPLAKQYRLPFPHNSFHSNLYFDLLYCDLWGPYRISTINGCKYFLTIVDDHSMCVWTFLLPSKDHVFRTFHNFHAYVLNQFHTTIKSIRIDNGTEFFNHEFSTFLARLGIVHQSSSANIPQQMA